MATSVFQGRRGVRPIKAAPAVCYGYRLAFTAIGLPPLEPSFASLEPSFSSDSCHGVLYTVTWLDWLRICASEGVPIGYQTLTVSVVPYKPNAPLAPLPTATHGQTNALTLRYRQPQSVLLNLPPLEVLPPSRRYMGLLREGAREAGLVGDWQRRLADRPSLF